MKVARNENYLEGFRDLISPVTVDDFFARYWEKTFLHVQDSHDRFSNYFSLRDVDSWLTSTQGNLFITTHDTEPRTDRYQPQEISLSIGYAAVAKGCSLVLDSLESWPPLQGLIKALGRDFHADIDVKAYLTTPKGAKSFPPHAAGQDILILQLEGERVWHLHEFSLLQVNPPQKKNFKFPLEWYGRTKTPLLAEVVLKPGNVLYIPRGMPHQAIAQNGACLCLYIGITPLFWMDFLKIAAECAALHSQDVRRSLPPGFVEDQELCERMRCTFREVMRIFQEVTSFDEVLAAIKRNRVTLQKYPSDGHIAQVLALEGLTIDSQVERRRSVLCAVDEIVDIERKTKSAIFFGNEHVTGPLHLRRALEFIRDHARFRVSEVPGLDAKGQLTLVRRLITEGLLRRELESKHLEHLVPALSPA